jgi:hypothetical protein
MHGCAKFRQEISFGCEQREQGFGYQLVPAIQGKKMGPAAALASYDVKIFEPG